MVNNLASLRGAVKADMRSVVERELGFIKAAETEEDIAFNLALWKKVEVNTFHCAVSSGLFQSLYALTFVCADF